MLVKSRRRFESATPIFLRIQNTNGLVKLFLNQSHGCFEVRITGDKNRAIESVIKRIYQQM
jgi:hypothetical protein